MTLTESRDWAPLVDLLANIANRVLRGIRNAGRVVHVSELKVDLSQAESYIKRWLVTIDDASGKPRVLISEPEDPFASFIASVTGGTATPSGELRVATWQNITEVVEENRPPEPEQEFFINAIEHLRLDNARYALLEAVICLEIVLAQYLSLFLERRNIPKSRIKEFVGPQLPLRDRVDIILELTLGHDALSKIDLPKALAAINWRNIVVHKTGHLPQDLKDDTVKDGIYAVLDLVVVVARKRHELLAAPELQAISEEISKELGGGLGTPVPILESPGGHNVHVQFLYFAAANIPDADVQLQRLVERVAEKLERRDPKFDRNEHLWVEFIAFPKEVHTVFARGLLNSRSDRVKTAPMHRERRGKFCLISSHPSAPGSLSKILPNRRCWGKRPKTSPQGGR